MAAKREPPPPVVEADLNDQPVAVSAEIRQGCMAQSLRRAARAATREYDALLAPFDLSIGQLSTLAAVDQGAPVPLGLLAEFLGMDRTTLNRNLLPLERRGLIRSAPTKEDGRVRGLSLTAAGRRLLERAAPAWRQAQAATLAKVPGWPLIGPALAVLG
jgi:DNA-binding MarR family transcriptional regulator